MNDVICKSCGWKGHHSRLKGHYEEVGLELIWHTYCPRCQSEEVEPLETTEDYFVGYNIETGEEFEEPEKLIHFHAVMQLLENEITWHKKMEGIAPSPEFGKGFIQGLIQARYLISELSEIDYLLPDGDLNG